MSKWMTADWTVGQLNALVKKIGDGNARGILDGTVEFTVTALMREFLHPAGVTTLPAATEIFDPVAHFQTREGLHIWGWFKDRILKYVHEVDGSPETTLSAFDLTKPANDVEIRKELPEDHVFGDPSEFCAILAQMIDRQPNGEEGDLLSNGYWNIFYVQATGVVFAVGVRWLGGHREWCVRADPLNNVRWSGRLRFLSATA